MDKSCKTELCIQCKTKLVVIKKVKLCKRCYSQARYSRYKKRTGYGYVRYSSEIEFIKNFFTHKNWLYHPTIFRMNGINYEPDFYDGERNTFIEVSGTIQAFHANFNKYELFIKTFPKIKFEVRDVSGNIKPLTKKVYAKRRPVAENKS